MGSGGFLCPRAVSWDRQLLATCELPMHTVTTDGVISGLYVASRDFDQRRDAPRVATRKQLWVISELLSTPC